MHSPEENSCSKEFPKIHVAEPTKTRVIRKKNSQVAVTETDS